MYNHHKGEFIKIVKKWSEEYAIGNIFKIIKSKKCFALNDL